MVNLKTASAFQDVDAKQIGTVTVCPADERVLTLIAPLPGQTPALTEAMEGALGLGFPEPGGVTRAGDIRCVWMGRDQAVLIGSAPLAEWQWPALISDQSDGWAVLQVSGPEAAEVLVRSMPINVRAMEGAARTQCAHIPISVSRIGPESYEIMCFRSMAQSLFREIAHSAALLAARRELS